MAVYGTTARAGSPALIDDVLNAISVLNSIDATSSVHVTAIGGYRAARVGKGVTAIKQLA